ncbi:oligosaccharide flippase family protein [Streptomyces sp. AK010]|uniref:oligosaccharide flippase family protein n=1 Tax=Streptomyces sp. AK010 TaxID=2723074 RepID=UPI001614542F|nr:oligosaccharide flippase family protein [Streptomyces sp. AK010]MBB6415300.1 O-antigen/teichoic acid export membrane protein [Streptomyces sp. AK010]
MRIDGGPAGGARTGEETVLSGEERPHSRAVVSGTLWNYSAAVVASLLQLGYTAYTGRAVSAAAFGAFASALSITQLLGYFANAGLATTVLRSRELTRGLLVATVRLGLLSGLVCFALVQATAPLWAEVWNAPETTGLLRVLALQFLFLPVGAVSAAGLRRLQAQRAAVLVETGALAAGLLTGTLLLAAGWTPLGLAATSVTTQLGIAVLAGMLVARRLPPGDRTCGRPGRYRELAGSSGFLAGHQLAQYVTNTVPLWAAGAVLGPVAAGYYSRSTLFTGLLLTTLAAGLTRVTTPALTRVRAQAPEPSPEARPPGGREEPAVRRAATDVLLAASALSFLPFAFLAGAGSGALRLLLGPGWDEAAGLVPPLCLFSAVAVVYAVGLSVDTVCGSHRRMAAAQAAAAVVTLAGAVLATAGDSLTLLALAALTGQLGGLAVQMWKWRGHGVVEARRLWVGYAVHAALGLAAYASGAALSRTAAGLPCPAVLLVLPAVGLAVVLCRPLRTRLPLYRVAAARGLLPLRVPVLRRSRTTRPQAQ